jgi:two-component system, LuxR family, response regulator FixJ
MGQNSRLIAILDDEEHFRRALERLLKAHGYDVASFAGGEELIAEATLRGFDCVLLDLHMPGKTGFEVLAELQSRPASPPVIVITAHDDPDFVRRARDLNAFEYQLKPVASPALLAAIERACAR